MLWRTNAITSRSPSRRPMPRLELVIRQLVRAQFGRKSERLDPEQFQLTLENLEQEIAAAKAPRQEAEDSDANRRPRRAPARRNLGHLPAHLERYEVVIEPEDRNCPCCGGALHQIAVEETERLDAVPLRLRVRVTSGSFADSVIAYHTDFKDD